MNQDEKVLCIGNSKCRSRVALSLNSGGGCALCEPEAYENVLFIFALKFYFGRQIREKMCGRGRGITKYSDLSMILIKIAKKCVGVYHLEFG